MSKVLNTRISLRTDHLSNWTAQNPVLGNGELAIVKLEDGTENIKLGNGLSSFTELPYLYQNKVVSDKIYTTELRAKSISQGYNVKSTPTSLATGIFTEADGNFDVVHGIEAKALSTDNYAFVFNGENLPGITERYTSHGEGSFNVNPLSGLNGFYIGEQSLSSIFSNYFLSSEISNYYTKTQVNGLWLDLDNKIIVVDNKLSDYYMKSETSSAIEISSALSNDIKIVSGTGIGSIMQKFTDDAAQFSSSKNKAYGLQAVALGHANTAGNKDYPCTDSTYDRTRADAGYAAFAEGSGTLALANASHAEGMNTIASGYISHAEGNSVSAAGYVSHAEGERTYASGYVSHAEGIDSVASGEAAHVEGMQNTASGYESHAEGGWNIADGTCSHAEGNTTSALGSASHSEGWNTIASAEGSHAAGKNAVAKDSYSYVWNGTNTRLSSNGSNTFNVYPEQGLSGFYIDGQNLAESIKQRSSRTIMNIWTD